LNYRYHSFPLTVMSHGIPIQVRDTMLKIRHPGGF